MKRHHQRRPVRQHGHRFSWARLPRPDNGPVYWHLYRRSGVTRAIYLERVRGDAGESRREIAARLRAARRDLLKRVDAIELQALGLQP